MPDNENIKLRDPKTLEIPSGIETAALLGRLTFFIGNGVSRLYGLHHWEALADEMLLRLAKNGIINHDTLNLLGRYSTKVKISIADGHFKANLKSKKYKDLSYSDILTKNLTKEKMQSVPVYASIAKCGVRFITTNYDQILVEFLEGLDADAESVGTSVPPGEDEPKRSVDKRSASRVQIYNRLSEVNSAAVLKNNVVFQIHGSVADEETIVASTESYLRLYGDSDNREALQILFENQTVVFIGYGLEEMELLDLVVRASQPKSGTNSKTKFYCLLPLLSHQASVLEHLKGYYSQLGIEVIEFCSDEAGHNTLGEVLEPWAEKLAKLVKEPSFIDGKATIDKLIDELDGVKNEK